MLRRRRNHGRTAVGAGLAVALAAPAIAYATGSLAPEAIPALLASLAPAAAPDHELPPAPTTRPAARAAPAGPPKATERAADIGALPPSQIGTATSLSLAGAAPPVAATALAALGARSAGPVGLVAGSLVAPLGGGLAVQADGLAGGTGRGALAGGALQFLLVDPRWGAVGASLSASDLPSRTGADAALRAGLVARLGLGALGAEVLAGYEDVAGRARAFDAVDLVWRPTADLRLSVGHRRLEGRDLAAAGVEARLGDALSVVGEGRVGPGQAGRDLDFAALVGLRFGIPSPDAMPNRLVEDALVPSRGR